jgi:putative transposase
MPYNPSIHHRRSIRLKGYDYSQAGLYFVTICLQDRKCLFGKIENGEMILNDAGKMIEKWYQELENKYGDIKCHEMVIMPNHFHCIIENVGIVGVDLRVDPNDSDPNVTGEQNVGANRCVRPLHCVIQWFKTMTTNEYIRGVKQFGWPSFNRKLWQRNYWEHIIRDENAYHRISEYIINNPKNWENDKLNRK